VEEFISLVLHFIDVSATIFKNKAGKIDEYRHYLRIMNQKLKNGMSADEIEAVQKRAEEAARA